MNYQLDNAEYCLNNGNEISAQAHALTGILALLVEMREEDLVAKEESKREGRDGTWEVEWFVEVPGRPPFRFPTEEDAYAGAVHASETVPPDEVKVFSTELKRYNRVEVPPAEWQAYVEPT